MVDAARFERAGIPVAVIGLPQLLDTVGRATARSMGIPSVRFCYVPGNLAHALDYVPEDSPFWEESVDFLVPQVVSSLTSHDETT